jgi:Ca2+-binding RTX toxin-like protein
MLFNGSNIAEVMDVSANGSRALFTRNIANITMDLNDVERIDVNTLGGADVITVHDMSGTDVTQVNVNLDAIGGAGDGAADQVIVEATSGNDSLEFTGSGATASVLGLAAITSVSSVEAADQFIVDGLGGNDVLSASLDQAATPTLVFEGGDGEDSAQVHGSDGADIFGIAANGTHARVDAGNLHLDVGTTESLVIDAGDGDDSISAVGNLAQLTNLILDGGAGNDTIRGGNGADLLLGGDGNDFIDGNQGNDTALMGAGDDTFQWDPGDGSDIVEGQAGFDTMLFNGSNIAENMEVSANGSRILFTRNIGNITMDVNDVERIDVTTLGGADNVVVNDLSGTDVTEVNVNLAASGGGGDGSADVVTVNATSGDDVAVISGDAGGLSVLGLAARLSITGAEGGLDQLHVNAGAGDDVIDASGVAAGSIGLVLDGGEGNDIIIGSAGDDVLIGGPGDDVLIGGGGNDTLVAAPGNDTVIQGFAAGAGSDDVIDLRGIAGAQDFAWVIAHASDVDGNAVLDLGGEHVTIDNVSVASLHSDDFLLG